MDDGFEENEEDENAYNLSPVCEERNNLGSFVNRNKSLFWMPLYL